MRSLMLVAAMFMAVITAQAITLDEIIAKNLEARGGKDKITSLQQYRADITMRGMGAEMKMTQYYKKPKMTRMEIEFQGMKMVMATKDTMGWSLNPMQGPKAELMSAEQVKSMRRQNDFEGEFINTKEKGIKLEYVGTADVDGSTAYKVKVTHDDESVEVAYFDAISFLEMKREMKMNMMGQDLEVEMVYSNYQEVDGIQVPFTIDVMSQGQAVQSLNFTLIDTKAKVDDSLFAMPKQ
jgi:outer membrane lipoprotein-sorting protein